MLAGYVRLIVTSRPRAVHRPFHTRLDPNMALSIESTNPVVRAVIEGKAPRNAQVAAARGILPLPPTDLLEILVNLVRSEDEELSRLASGTIREQDNTLLLDAINDQSVATSVLGYFAEHAEVVEIGVATAAINNGRTPEASIVALAQNAKKGELLELLSLNQQLLLRSPGLIDAIIANPHRTSEAERRASETKREFFEKERGAKQIANELRAQGKIAAAEFFESSEMDGSDLSAEDAILLAEMIEIPDADIDDSWMGLEYLEEFYEETPEERAAIVNRILGELSADEFDLPTERISMINRIMKMGMKDRVRLAMKGDREARNILIRDPNRIVCQAVVNNPKITEQEVEKIAAMRSVTEDVLRKIANDRQWARSYPIMHNLARNPRTPIANVLPILTRLQLRDLNAISKSKNVPDAVRRQALRLSQARSGR